MAEPLYRLVYRSRPVIDGSQEELRRQLGQILRASRRRNPALELTGALMLRDGCFIQALEGPLPALESLFEIICRDERHGSVSLLELTPIDRRGFAGWAMAWIDATGTAGSANASDSPVPLVPGTAEAGTIIAAMQAALSTVPSRH